MQILSEEQLVGQTLGNYRIEHLVGKGQLTAVYLARHMSEQRVDALTLYLMPESFSNESHKLFLTRFRKEATLINTLDHPHILPIYAHGEVAGYPYLVTPYMMHGSLSDLAKQEGRIEHSQVHMLLHQVVEGLSYAHTRGFIHGTLKPSNIVWRKDDSLQVAGFGLMHMLQRSGLEKVSPQYAHLLSVANTFLAAPEYIAPEVVAGQSIDRRSDIYAVGCILFELLSGRTPFSGSNPLEVALQHTKASAPSLRTVCPDVPISLALVVAQAMMRDPEQRFQDVNELDEAFAQASLGSTQHNLPSVKMRPADDFSTGQHRASSKHSATGQYNATGSWQFLPPIVTGRLPSVNLPAGNTSMRQAQSTRENAALPFASAEQSIREAQRPETGAYTAPAPPTLPPPVAVAPAASVVQPKPMVEMKAPATKDLNAPVAKDLKGVPMPGVTLAGDLVSEDELMKTYNWWSEPQGGKAPAAPNPHAQAKVAAPVPDPKPLVLPSTDTLDWGLENVNSSSSNRRRKSTAPLGEPRGKMKRRRVLALLGAGVVAAGVGAGISFQMHGVPGFSSMQQATQSSSTTSGTTTAQNTKTGTKNTATTKATHTGTVIAVQTLAKNSAAMFTNPTDKQSSLLIHLASESFVAYEQACTHQGVHVNYDPKTQMLVCPAHGAIFNPAKAGAVVQGPATTPIASVKISVNSDGTITV